MNCRQCKRRLGDDALLVIGPDGEAIHVCTWLCLTQLAALRLVASDEPIPVGAR